MVSPCCFPLGSSDLGCLSSIAGSSRRSTVRHHIHARQATESHSTHTQTHTQHQRTRQKGLPKKKGGRPRPGPRNPECKQNGGNCTQPTRGENVAVTMLLTRSSSSRRATPAGRHHWRSRHAQRKAEPRRCRRVP